MTNNQHAQTTNSNDNITEQDISEQDLQKIVGGCFPCGAVGVSAAVEASTKVADGVKTGINAIQTSTVLKEVTKADNVKGTAKVAALGAVVSQSVKNVMAKPQIAPCDKVITLAAQYGAISKHL